MTLTPFQEALSRFLRASGLTQLQLAQRTGYAPSSVNRWLSGQVTPTRDRAEALDKILGARGELLKTWLLTATGSALPEWARDLYSIESGSVRLAVATPSQVPGYLQSPGYASWVFRAGRPTLHGGELDRLVKHRTQRLRALPGLSVTAVFPLSAVADLPKAMREGQTQHLLEWIDTGRVFVHLVPRGLLLPAPVAPLMLFTTSDGDTVALSDHVEGFVTLEDHEPASALFHVALADSLPAPYSRNELERLL